MKYRVLFRVSFSATTPIELPKGLLYMFDSNNFFGNEF